MSHATSRSTNTNRGFVAFVCQGCKARDGVDLMAAVRSVIRHCPAGILAESPCILGDSPCTMHTRGEGVIVAVQRSSSDQRELIPQICGPIATNADLTEFCFWLESGPAS